MISSHRLYRFFAEKLFKELIGKTFSHALSFTKDGLLLHFISKGNTQSYEVKFVEGELLIVNANWTDVKSKLKSNAVVQFKELESKVVEDVLFGLFDRVFAIKFNDGSRLLFKSFGKFGNVIHFHQDENIPSNVFRLNFKKDWELEWSEISTFWQSVLSDIIDAPLITSKENWKNSIKGLDIQDVLNIYPDFFDMNLKEQRMILLQLSNPMNFIAKIEFRGEIARLKWTPIENRTWMDLQKDFEEQIRTYLRWYFFEREKAMLQSESIRQLKSINQRLKTYQSRKDTLLNQRSFKEIGDLILGHAHSIRKGISEALITDFFTGQRIRIKLNPDLSAAENAEKCYKKSKNQGLEIANLDSQILALITQKETWESVQKGVEKAESPRDLRLFREFIPQSKNNTKTQDTQKPYKKMIYKGFEVWLGKNAKSNDALLRESNKSDLWMHAADVTGSHVIIRNVGKNVPKDILEEIASFCAFHSKGKSQTIQTVMYTERKMVSKSKNGAPGGVKVSKFHTIDVEPKNLSDFS